LGFAGLAGLVVVAAFGGDTVGAVWARVRRRLGIIAPRSPQ